MDGAIFTHPDWVIDRARPLAESIVTRGKSEHYDEAVGWLKKVQAAYLVRGKQAQRSAYRSSLVKLHGHKYKLLELFKSFERS